MTGLATSTAMQQEACRNCGHILRQRRAKTKVGSVSHLANFLPVPQTANIEQDGRP